MKKNSKNSLCVCVQISMTLLDVYRFQRELKFASSIHQCFSVFHIDFVKAI